MRPFLPLFGVFFLLFFEQSSAIAQTTQISQSLNRTKQSLVSGCRQDAAELGLEDGSVAYSKFVDRCSDPLRRVLENIREKQTFDENIVLVLVLSIIAYWGGVAVSAPYMVKFSQMNGLWSFASWIPVLHLIPLYLAARKLAKKEWEAEKSL